LKIQSPEINESYFCFSKYIINKYHYQNRLFIVFEHFAHIILIRIFEL